MTRKIGPTLKTRMAILRREPPMHEFTLHLFDGNKLTIYGRTFIDACRNNGLDSEEIHKNIREWKFDGRPQEGHLPELDTEQAC